jgi:hypothetical protein
MVPSPVEGTVQHPINPLVGHASTIVPLVPVQFEETEAAS